MAVKKSGQSVLFKFPQTDLALGKMRPALLFAPLPSGRNDWLVCMISSQVSQAVAGVDEVIATNDADFGQSGLKADSVIRLTRLAVVSDSIFHGLIGEISTVRLSRLKKRLAQWIESS
ncbi:MAG: type II toxin-antitoxin system PemK/MazF family toxin [Acidobacteriota bacterium]|nr:type II toxin-antitoxin system PemK/MazF family toxin [Acidobacteriota bacterium]